MYKKTFSNEDFCIKLSTSSRRILSLVNNYLDFNGKNRPDTDMTVDFCIEEGSRKKPTTKSAIIYPELIMRETKWDGSLSIVIPSATVKVDYAGKKVKAVIFDYLDSLKEPLLDFVLFKPLHMIMAKKRFYCVHASAVRKESECILICGSQNSGKSTIAFLFSQHGFGILCDDDCFVGLNKGRVLLHPFPTKMGVKDNFITKYPSSKKHLVKNYRYGGKKRISLSKIYDVNKRCYDEISLLFPRYSKKEKFCVKNIPRTEALKRLIVENAEPWMDGRDPKGFSKVFFTFHTLINNARCFEIVYNDKTIARIPKEFERRAF